MCSWVDVVGCMVGGVCVCVSCMCMVCGGWWVSVGWSYLACANLDPSMHACRSLFAWFVMALRMHLDMCFQW